MDRIEIDKSMLLFPEISWVATAVSKNSNNYDAISHICIQNGWVVATDTKRIHVLYLENDMQPSWEDGLYRILVNKKSEFVAVKNDVVGIFPDWIKVFPKELPNIQIEITINTKFPESSYSKVIRELPAEKLLYYKQFVELGDYHYFVLFYENGPVCFLGERRLAAIMPIKI